MKGSQGSSSSSSGGSSNSKNRTAVDAAGGGGGGGGPPSAIAPFRIKVLSMGSAGTGKSCLIKRYCEERFVSKYIATIGVDYGVKPVKVDQMDIRVNFWDLSGHKEFFEGMRGSFCSTVFLRPLLMTLPPSFFVSAHIRISFTVRPNSVRNEFYKDTQGCVLVYDVSSRETFDDLDNWLNEAIKYGANPREMPIALCANKVDAKKRMVTEDEGRQYAVSRGLMYFETSASNGQNVHEIFEYLFREIVRHSDQ